MSLIVPHIERKSIPSVILLSTLYGSPSKPLRGRTIHRIKQGVRGYSIVPLLFFSQSTVLPKRGYG